MDVNIDPAAYYPPAEAGVFLGVKEATIKAYCRKGRVRGENGRHIKVETKKVGPREEWRIRGSTLMRIRKAWGLAT